jgi:uncharacterized protein (TIGR03084 family)
VDALCDDLAAEHAELDRVVSGAPGLDVPTPAPGWSVGDQIAHLWFFDRKALLAVTHPSAFADDARSLLAAIAADGGRTDMSVVEGRTRPAEDLLARWREDRAALVERARRLDPKLRVPWYGPAMSARSFVTARLMETWAHGQDVADGLGLTRAPTDRLRHVAHIGVGARPFSYVANGRTPPDDEVRVELVAPSGGEWSWGPPAAVDRVRGPALDFCLVVTQRRHLADVDLEIDGDSAAEWMAIAQAFAGPPGPGRRPGQFTGR